MFEVAMLFGVIALLIAWGAKPLIPIFSYRLKKSRGRKLVALAEKLGPVLYRNTINKATGICRADDFKSTAKTKKTKAWEPLGSVRVRPTFSFRMADDPLQARVHVIVTKEDLEVFAEDLISRLTGYTSDQVDKASFTKATNLLIALNRQLFVPFATELSDEEGERQLDFYGSTPSFTDIRAYLLR